MSAQAVVNVLVEHSQLFNDFQVKGAEKMNVRSGLAVRTFALLHGGPENVEVKEHKIKLHDAEVSDQPGDCRDL
jgi:hypothetical protein